MENLKNVEDMNFDDLFLPPEDYVLPTLLEEVENIIRYYETMIEIEGDDSVGEEFHWLLDLLRCAKEFIPENAEFKRKMY